MQSHTLLPQEIIRRKRDGGTLHPAELQFFVDGLSERADGTTGLSEGQVAAFAMAVFFQGMSLDECITLTQAMMRSGKVLDWSGHNFGKPIVDKHSTGGVGDKISLFLAPMLSACGAVVPMISGRGLGHTGGTLDKVEAIPGYCARPSPSKWGEVLREAGCAIIGQTPDIAPADRRFYAIRDVTATVESIPLITASILSKKLAAGLDRLVLDVKFGSGAFASTYEMASDLARSLVDVANRAGLPTTALLTDMNQVLGPTAGNAIEVREAIAYLTGAHRDSRVHEVTIALASELLVGVGLCRNIDDARSRLVSTLEDGSAAERFAKMVSALGGPSDLLERSDAHLPSAPHREPVFPPREGIVRRVDTRAVGLAVVDLGGGRRRADESIDPRVGLTEVVGLGQAVDDQQPLAWIHARTPEDAQVAARRLTSAIEVGPDGVDPSPIVVERMEARDLE